ncbi:MAG: NADP-dependent malic enzyme [Saprospiraceae bacterium]|nr:NADP-dependent malic enzyme [Saprospiraceae bacterium]
MEPEDKKREGLRKAALHYHEHTRRGKIEVVPTKPCVTQDDLSLAYTPGVAEPCLEIAKEPALARKYTSKGNLVAVVSNGTAVLGLGNIGALAGKPVMEGKGVLFKRFADIDVFDIEVGSEDPEEVIRTVRNIAPTFGGINLEDIKAPECFYIEETLKKELDIPVFHDDQHGTAIISGAALINAVELAGKKLAEVKLVVSGAGAAGIACANFYISLGVRLENILMTDSKGVLWIGRGDEDRNPYKQKFFRQTEARNLSDAMRGADVFCGVSQKNVLTPEMVRTMADTPIIFAMANPDPEITYPLAKEARPDAIVATGRSDYPNQVNNVLGFPFIFRGALDVQATGINEPMKLAAAHALAALAKEEVPDNVKRAYGDASLSFGPDYIIPKPFDHRVLVWASAAVAEAAIKTGVAKNEINIEEYKESLRDKVDWSREFMRNIYTTAQKSPKRIVFPEGDDPKIIWAASEIIQEGYAIPILLTNNKEELIAHFEELHHDCEGIEIIEPDKWPYRNDYVQEYYRLRQRKGKSLTGASMSLRNNFYFATMMVHMGHADGMVAGETVSYPEVLRPALKIIGSKPDHNLVAGMYMVQHERRNYFFADAAVNINPTAEELALITVMAAEEMERLHMEPRVAMLSFSSFGTVRAPETEKVMKAVELVRKMKPGMPVDGPVQPDLALDQEAIAQIYPFADLRRRPNLLIFPNLDAGNISLRLLRSLSQAKSIGPLIMGLNKPIHLLPRGTEVNNIVNLAAIACVDAQYVEESRHAREIHQ